MKKFTIINIAVLIIAVALGYYFIYFLPQNNREKFAWEKEKYNIEKDEKSKETIRNIQNDCINNTKNSVTSDFDLVNLSSNPLFYPYEDVSSFNLNAKIVIALEGYKTCLINDSRLDKDDAHKQEKLDEANAAIKVIEDFMKTVKNKNSDICKSLDKGASRQCENLN